MLYVSLLCHQIVRRSVEPLQRKIRQFWKKFMADDKSNHMRWVVWCVKVSTELHYQIWIRILIMLFIICLADPDPENPAPPRYLPWHKPGADAAADRHGPDEMGRTAHVWQGWGTDRLSTLWGMVYNTCRNPSLSFIICGVGSILSLEPTSHHPVVATG